jgi:hypothetical protein
MGDKMNDYSSTNYRFVDNPRKSNFSDTIDKAVVRNDTGNLQVYQCRGVLHKEKCVTQNQKDFNNKTISDCMVLFKQRMSSVKIVKHS